MVGKAGGQAAPALRGHTVTLRGPGICLWRSRRGLGREGDGRWAGGAGGGWSVAPGGWTEAVLLQVGRK